MRIKDLLERWNLKKIKIKTSFFDAEFEPGDKDKDAAWSLYVELLTRITTQPLKDEEGVEKTALESVHKIFQITRDILKEYGRECIQFSKIAIPVLNQIIRPFTAKWHKALENGDLEKGECKAQFRIELKELRMDLRYYTSLLSELAGVEDLTGLEEENPLA